MSDHKSNQRNTARTGAINGICVKCKNALVMNADDPEERTQESIHGNLIKEKNTTIKNCTKQVHTLAKLETRTGLQKELLSSSKKRISII